MAVDNSALGLLNVEIREIGKGFPDSRNRLKSADALGSEQQNKTLGAAKQTEAAYIGSKEARESFRQARRDIAQQATTIAALVNEKGTLVESALSANSKQLESAKKTRDLMKTGAAAEEIAAEQQQYLKLQEIGQEVEEDIVVHNIESRADQFQSIISGGKIEATFKLDPVEYRAIEGELDTMEGVEKTITQLRSTRDDLRAQNSHLRETRTAVKSAAANALEEVKGFADTAIRSLDEAVYAAHNIAGFIGSGSVDFIAAHAGLNGSNPALTILEEEE